MTSSSPILDFNALAAPKVHSRRVEMETPLALLGPQGLPLPWGTRFVFELPQHVYDWESLGFEAYLADEGKTIVVSGPEPYAEWFFHEREIEALRYMQKADDAAADASTVVVPDLGPGRVDLLTEPLARAIAQLPPVDQSPWGGEFPAERVEMEAALDLRDAQRAKQPDGTVFFVNPTGEGFPAQDLLFKAHLEDGGRTVVIEGPHVETERFLRQNKSLDAAALMKKVGDFVAETEVAWLNGERAGLFSAQKN